MQQPLLIYTPLTILSISIAVFKISSKSFKYNIFGPSDFASVGFGWTSANIASTPIARPALKSG